jgi:hypothetical protein
MLNEMSAALSESNRLKCIVAKLHRPCINFIEFSPLSLEISTSGKDYKTHYGNNPTE